MTFISLMRKAVRIYPNNIAVVCEDESLTYTELWERSCRLANGLLALGLQQGDRVATLGDNALESIEEICALAMAGLVRCPMYAFNSSETHTYLLNHVDARALIVQGVYRDAVHTETSDLALEHVIVRGTVEVSGADHHYQQFLDASSTEDPAIEIDEDDNYCIRFSAGTTGRPKGIVHTHRGWREMAHEFSLSLPMIEEEDAFLAATSISHGSGLWVWEMIPRGARYVIMPKFDAGQFLELVESLRCTMTILVPTMIRDIANYPGAEKFDLSSLKCVVYGAAPVNERTLIEAHPILGDTLYQMYGQSEALTVTLLPPRYHVAEGTEQEKQYLNSAGRPTPNSIIEILDENDQELPAMEIGEVCVCTPGDMKEIWKDPEATKKRFTASGCIRTGDMGYVDTAGFLFLCDRKDDMIISGGYNVWPAEVENALVLHDAVFEAAVVSEPDDKWGEAVVAVVVLREGESVSEQELIEWCRGRVGSVKKPRRIVFSDEPLPRSGIGKVLRKEIRSQFWGKEARSIRGA